MARAWVWCKQSGHPACSVLHSGIARSNINLSFQHSLIQELLLDFRRVLQRVTKAIGRCVQSVNRHQWIIGQTKVFLC
jgi:hypothetical protein